MSKTNGDHRSDRKLLGIRYAVRGGLEIQSRFPFMADDYRAMLGVPAIIDKYGLVDELGFKNFRITSSSIHFAFKGNDNRAYGPVYSGLLSQEEAQGLGARHLEQARNICPINPLNFSVRLSPDERAERNRKQGI